ncbi:MAG: selB [Bacillota bacterium]|nr:selB [Bacillota bacterium]
MKNVIIGTAGHIDHGKTTLIKALTGRDTDRWEEEKRRGITIDLGFTYFDLPDGNKAGIVDVPGHEKFIKNMVAGVIGMDLVLLVIAADEGIMPQTREHINILNILGIKKGIVVLTKCDLVDEEWLFLVKEDIKEELNGTFLQNAPIQEVSSITKYGFSDLINTISKLTQDELEERNINTIPRLPIDRSFSISGFGTVITGTLISGKLKKGDEVEIYPINKLAKIRNLQVHSKDVEYALAGQRTAVNLQNVKKSEIYRGCVIAPVNAMKNTTLLDVKINLLKNSRRIVENKSRLHLYTGTSEILCRIVLLDKNELSPGETCYAQLILEEEIAVRRGDKFIIRFYSPMETIGGGEIIEPIPTKKKRFDNDLLQDLKIKEKGSNEDVIEKIIGENSKKIPSSTDLARLTALTMDEIKNNIINLEKEEKITVFNIKSDIFVWHKNYESEIESSLQKYLISFHEQNKYKKGVKKSEIKSKFFTEIKQNIFDAVIIHLLTKNIFKIDGEYLSLFDFNIILDENFLSAQNEIIKLIEQAKYNFIKPEDILSKNFKNINGSDVLNVMIDDKKLIKISEDCILTVSLFNTSKEILVDFIKKNGKITAADYRDLLDTNRKNAIILLEYFDAIKVTRRNGNDRVLF